MSWNAIAAKKRSEMAELSCLGFLLIA